MFGPSNMPDYGRHFEPLEPWIEKMKLDFAMEDIVPVFAKLMLRYQGKLVSMPYDGDIHIMYWNKPAFERPDNRTKFKAKYKYDLQPPKTWKQWDDAAEFFHGWGWDGTQAQALRRRRLLQAQWRRLLVLLVAPAVLLVRRPVLRREHEAAHQLGGGRARARGDGQDDAVLSARRAPLRGGGAEDDADQGRGAAPLFVDLDRQAGGQPGRVVDRGQGRLRPGARRRHRRQDRPPPGDHARPRHGRLEILEEEGSHVSRF